MVCVALAFLSSDPVVNLASFGGVADGKTDVSAALQKAYDALPETGGTIEVPAGKKPYIIRAEQPTVRNPKIGLRIKKPNVFIVGTNGRPTFLMTGMTLEEQNAAEDFNKSGRDWFCVFSFFLTEGGGVKNVHIKGQWNGAGRYKYGVPRAKGISVLGSKDVTIEDVTGERIFGNLICAVASSGEIDGKHEWTENLRVEAVQANHCVENGVNFMGGTRNCVLDGALLAANGSTGIESGGENNVLQNVTSFGNGMAGASISQKGTSIKDSRLYGNGAVDRTDGGFGLIMNGEGLSADNVTVTGNSQFGIYVYPKSKGVTINNCTVRGNSGGANPNAKAEICLAPGAQDVELTDTLIEKGFDQISTAGKLGKDLLDWKVNLDEGLPRSLPGITGAAVLLLNDTGTPMATGIVKSYRRGNKTLSIKITTGTPSIGRCKIKIGSQSSMSIQAMADSSFKVRRLRLKGMKKPTLAPGARGEELEPSVILNP